MEEIVEFKSIPRNYEKESNDIKNNTFRKLDGNDNRFRLLNLWGIKHKYGKIRIINSETKHYFERQIRDITFWDGYFIITWEEASFPPKLKGMGIHEAI